MKNQLPNSAQLEILKNEVNLYIMMMTEEVSKRTGLSSEYSRAIVLRNLARQKGISMSEIPQA